jgi:hypothetical protein
VVFSKKIVRVSILSSWLFLGLESKLKNYAFATLSKYQQLGTKDQPLIL